VGTAQLLRRQDLVLDTVPDCLAAGVRTERAAA
jgi:hypothetical protein